MPHREIIKRLAVFCLVFLLVCEVGFRIRLAILYKKPEWLLYHQFRLRTEAEIAREDLPQYYKANMFKPYKLNYARALPTKEKTIKTVESSALRSARRRLEKIVEKIPGLRWEECNTGKDKIITFSNNDVVLYEFMIYPDIYNTLKRDARVLKHIFGATIDDFLYHNLAFYMHIDENINFTMNSKKMIDHYINMLRSREEPLCREIANKGYKNIVYVMTPNRFDASTLGGSTYLKYIKAGRAAMLDMLEKYGVEYMDFMDEKMEYDDFSDYFHLTAKGADKISHRILEDLNKKGLIDAI